MYLYSIYILRSDDSTKTMKELVHIWENRLTYLFTKWGIGQYLSYISY